MRPPSGWLDGKNLTWFDVPGQCNRIWNGGSGGVACSDIDQMAGCILGGGTAINAGLWWKVSSPDKCQSNRCLTAPLAKSNRLGLQLSSRVEGSRYGSSNIQSVCSDSRNRSPFEGRQALSPPRFQCCQVRTVSSRVEECHGKQCPI